MPGCWFKSAQTCFNSGDFAVFPSRGCHLLVRGETLGGCARKSRGLLPSRTKTLFKADLLGRL